MPDILSSALSLATHAPTLLAALAGLSIGLVCGVLPGLSGLSTLAILLPFIYGLDPLTGVGFLLAAHAAVYTGGSVTAILLGIPGAPANAATVRDGFALHRQGRGLYAVGAALTASALGGLLSALALVLLLPLLQPVVLAFGAPEIFLLALVGIASVALLDQGEPLKGLVAAGLGLFLATFGYQRITGVPRFWMESDYLLDGIRLVPLVLGLFAIPEIVRLAGAGRRPAAAGTALRWRDLARGAAAVLERPWTFLRSVGIGVLVGIVPGVGGETAPYLAYAAARSRRDQDAAGAAGDIDGVIAPEASNNAKEGGSLVPTLALGIPGSAAMALLLGGFLILGIEPGPDFLVTHLDMATALAIILAVTNLVSALLMVPLAAGVAKLASIRGQFLAPVLLVLVVVGAYATGNSGTDVLFVFLFGALGLLMRRFNYSRPALVLGFILGPILETYLHISLQAYGPAFITRPISLTLGLMLVGVFAWSYLKSRADRRPGVTGP
jgi:TctA family transporter